MENTITQTQINEEFFKSEGYLISGDNTYQKQIGNILVEFKTYEENELLGLNIEIRYNGILKVSGYYHNREDFKKDLGL